MSYPVLLRSRTHGTKVVCVKENVYVVVKQPAEYLPRVGTIFNDGSMFVEDKIEDVEDYIHVIKKLNEEAYILYNATSSIL